MGTLCLPPAPPGGPSTPTMVSSMKSIRMLLACATLLVLASPTIGAQGGKVTCKDGSASAGGRGACSSHGGISTASNATVKTDAKVARTMGKAGDKKDNAEAKMVKMDAKEDARGAKAVAKAVAKADAKMDKAEDHEMKGAIAECRDHSYSHATSGRGVCSSHGGVAKFLTK